jgi:hypothetical protein
MDDYIFRPELTLEMMSNYPVSDAVMTQLAR